MRERAKKTVSSSDSPSRLDSMSTGCPELDEIRESCFSELMDYVTDVAERNGVNTNTIMNIQVSTVV